jgi:endonuclease G
LPSSTTNQIVKHDYYTLSYSAKFEQSECVAYRLNAKQQIGSKFERPFLLGIKLFLINLRIGKIIKRSIYDKGHLCHAGDMKFSEAAFEATFYTKNISLYTQEFNDGVWITLEQKVRYWYSKHSELYIITGGFLQVGLITVGK